MEKCLDELSVQIATMDKLKLVNFYYLYDRENEIQAAMVYYQNDKVINLSSLDMHFEMLMRRLFLLYHELENSEDIVADELTRKVLENGYLQTTVDYDTLLEGFGETGEQAYFRKNYAYYTLKGIIAYVVELLYGVRYENVCVGKLSRDWCGKGEITVTANNTRKRLHYRISTETPAFSQIAVSNVFDAGNVLTIDVSCGETGVEISFADTMHGYSGGISCFMVSDKFFERVRICEGDTVKVGTERIVEKKAWERKGKNDFLSRFFDNPACYELSCGMVMMREQRDKKTLTAYVSDDDECAYAYICGKRNVSIEGKAAFSFTEQTLTYYEPRKDRHYAIVKVEDKDKTYIKHI